MYDHQQEFRKSKTVWAYVGCALSQSLAPDVSIFSVICTRNIHTFAIQHVSCVVGLCYSHEWYVVNYWFVWSWFNECINFHTVSEKLIRKEPLSGDTRCAACYTHVVYVDWCRIFVVEEVILADMFSHPECQITVHPRQPKPRQRRTVDDVRKRIGSSVGIILHDWYWSLPRHNSDNPR